VKTAHGYLPYVPPAHYHTNLDMSGALRETSATVAQASAHQPKLDPDEAGGSPLLVTRDA
jgi:hypothetical protein